MSTEKKEDKGNEKKEENNTKDNKDDKKVENEKLKLVEKNPSKEDEKNNETDKKLQRAQRFGLAEKESDVKMSTDEELNKRKERFKDQIKEIEEEKEKAKGERGRIRRNNNYKNNNYRNSRDGRRTHRDFRRGGGKFHDRRIRGDRRNNSYRK